MKIIPCETSGQIALRLASPVCKVCPYGVEGRCKGPSTAASVWDRGQGEIGCTDTARQYYFYRNLMRHRPFHLQPLPSIPRLPAFMPVLGRGVAKDITLPDGLLYGISLGRLLKDSGELRYRSQDHLRRAFRIPKNARICLLGTGQEDLLMEALHRSLETNLWQALQELGFDLATSATFAVWEKQSRFDQIYAQDRNFASHDHLANLGVPTVPFFFCAEEEDYAAAARWLAERPQVNTVAALAQFHKTPRGFSGFFKSLCKFRDKMPRHFHLLIIGCGAADKIRQVYKEFPSATIATDKPVILGQSRQMVNPDLSKIQVSSLRRPSLVENNIKQFSAFCERLRSPEAKEVRSFAA